jgi:hypothetical protein
MYVVAIPSRDPVIEFRSKNIERLLRLGPLLGDERNTGKMRNASPIPLFRLKRVTTLIQEGCAARALYVLLWARIFTLRLSSVLSGEIRISTMQFVLRLPIFLREDVLRRMPSPNNSKAETPS